MWPHPYPKSGEVWGNLGGNSREEKTEGEREKMGHLLMVNEIWKLLDITFNKPLFSYFKYLIFWEHRERWIAFIHSCNTQGTVQMQMYITIKVLNSGRKTVHQNGAMLLSIGIIKTNVDKHFQVSICSVHVYSTMSTINAQFNKVTWVMFPLSSNAVWSIMYYSLSSEFFSCALQTSFCKTTFLLSYFHLQLLTFPFIKK